MKHEIEVNISRKTAVAYLGAENNSWVKLGVELLLWNCNALALRSLYRVAGSCPRARLTVGLSLWVIA